MTQPSRAAHATLGRSLVTGRTVLTPAVKLRSVKLTGLKALSEFKASAKKQVAVNTAAKKGSGKKASVKKTISSNAAASRAAAKKTK